ncbi:hypothetical protein PN498_06845 [Oscillatoria sp. CS-180]|uniref:hypothetical protein n=1 Tax=Oscillatoria sp. CS-180 TaxID=3021720 RepID=UPI002330139D|nr:hypothetical protein [Oscillatoria sp. CS-180]MDB9525699.1 hypothetical protein [Oscillatoria sp. CS-180]
MAIINLFFSTEKSAKKLLVMERSNMQPKEQILQDKDRGLNHIGQNFLVGTLFGLIPLFLSFLYYVFLGDSMDWNTFGTKFLVALPILSGILSAVFGKRFVAMLSDFMSYLG